MAPSRRRVAAALVLLVALVAAGLWYAWPTQSAVRDAIATEPEPPELTVDEVRRVEAFCGACHALPPAGSFARDAWHHEVLQGYEFYAESGRSDLDPPPPAAALAYFRARAPERLEFASEADTDRPWIVDFAPRRWPLVERHGIPPAVANLTHRRGAPGEAWQLIGCDMRSGEVWRLDPNRDRQPPHRLARLNNPCRVENCDLDGDGLGDLLVAELGSFDPDDHNRGAVVWLKSLADGSFQATRLVQGLGRVADARAADLDNDGDLDVVVAEFGWHATGGVHVLWNETARGGLPSFTPRFTAQRITSEPGAIHVPCHDLDGDGRLDIVALVSQEYERVELLLNRGHEPWQRQIAWAAPDPAFGSSGIELADLDQDGDPDVLYTNGDTFDSMTVKPSHGIQWLENQGNLQFAHHRLANLPGAYCARAGDLDQDGDLDIVASVWLPRITLSDPIDPDEQAAVVVLEQVAAGQFARRTLARGHAYFATLDLADLDDDGDLDLAVGSHLANVEQSPDEVVLWLNQLSARSAEPLD